MMPDSNSKAKSSPSLAFLKPASPGSHRAVIGLDGFVDSIIRVVEHKHPHAASTYYPDITSFAGRIRNAAGGKSTALELAVQRTKLGGNGPIMANALAALGIDVDCIGNLNSGDRIHPAFEEMAGRCRLISIGEAAYTDALEFSDGKIMLQKMECLDAIDGDAVINQVGQDRLVKLLNEADLVALNNWSAIPHMSQIWQRLQDDICPVLTPGRRRLIFFDLADPQKRHTDDVRQAMELVGRFRAWFDVILGLNEKESRHISEMLGCADADNGDTKVKLKNRAASIREAMDISSVVIHDLAFAVAATENEQEIVDGFFIKEPLISTGAGDHFNAGFCLGRVLEAELASSLLAGVACSGYYVRTAKSPVAGDLLQFVKDPK